MVALWRASIFVVLVLMAGDGLAQRMTAPAKDGAKSPAERAAYDKAMCVYRGLTQASSTTFGDTGSVPKDETPEESKRLLELYPKLAKEAVRACLSADEVMHLGRYSYFEDMALRGENRCNLRRTPAVLFERTPNNNDGDLVNGAVKWEIITDGASVDRHPFFKAQSEARAEFGDDVERICQALRDEFGAKGTRFPGLVR